MVVSQRVAVEYKGDEVDIQVDIWDKKIQDLEIWDDEIQGEDIQEKAEGEDGGEQVEVGVVEVVAVVLDSFEWN